MIKKVIYFGKPAYLSLGNKQLVVHSTDKSKPKVTIPIEDLGVVVLDNLQITITLGAMDALLQNNVAIVSCDSKHLPVGLQLPLEGNTLQSERFQYQLSASQPLKKQLWQQTIKSKILNQSFVLKTMRGVPTGNMEAWSKQVKSGDSTNLEARAAVYYWDNLFAEIENFNRYRYGDMPNSLLNYGYAIVRAMTARALVGTGLLPTLGIHHHNRYNAYCLADDIMEPYRPYVDRLVVEMVNEAFHNKQLEIAMTTEIKRKLLSLPVCDVHIDGQRRPMMVAIEITATSLLHCYQKKSRKIIYPEMMESENLANEDITI
ncbi:MAG: type II CRISPR-associated endonuclease Cas1 [Duncaniella sp.]|nr:type II CRISPR-associated endonuclease Cas1 [Duncaniella sp.]MDE7475084.1 type II CRISPR-associated endonuclease Cas1 [Duncaniella sp.]